MLLGAIWFVMQGGMQLEDSGLVRDAVGVNRELMLGGPVGALGVMAAVSWCAMQGGVRVDSTWL
jgi:hypothetical protein